MKRRLLSGMTVCACLLTGTVSGQGYSADNTEDMQSLKEAYADRFMIGTAGDFPRRYSEAELENVTFHYDIVTPENCMKPQPTHSSEDNYNFDTPDDLVDWCQDNDIKVWGHTLLWHAQTGRWFFQDDGEPADRKLALRRLKRHISKVVKHYKGDVIGWDVANESIADEGDWTTENLRDYSWYKTVGPDVLTLAFKWAHEADPDAVLYYNDYNIEQGASQNTGKHASSMILLKRLLDEGAPVHGVGIQGHWHLDTNLADVEQAIENYASLGLKVSITELDVTATGDNSGSFDVQTGEGTIPEENYVKQAEVYRKLFEIFNRHADVIERVTFWGVSDTRSWRGRQNALLFTGDLEPKPAFQAVLQAAASE